MKLSDYVAEFLVQQGVRHAFVVSGGASLHLIHSIAQRTDIDYICPQHEQGGAMAADGYARMTGNLGVAVATSGPGATNLITGICSSYFDSIPVLYLTGQVSTFRLSGDTGVRQLGFQETDVVSMCRHVTKYAVMVDDPKRIRFELEKAVWLARSGRPGPVLVDIPDNLQREQIEPAELEGFTPEPAAAEPPPDLDQAAMDCLEMLRRAERPVMVLGHGVRLAGAEAQTLALVRRLGVPTLLTWAVLDMMPHDDPLAVGSFGTHGNRHGNYTVQNADLVVSIGSRLDTHEVGSPFSHFARGARKVMVDIDGTEIDKFKRFDLVIDLPVKADARLFVEALAARLGEDAAALDIEPWRRRVAQWRERYPVVRPEYYRRPTLNPYVFVKALSDAAPPGAVVFTDTGCAVAWLSQAFQFKEGQRYVHAFNNTPMGYGLPGAVGASLALGGRPVISVNGDGGLHMNIQELATVRRHDLPIKVFVLNNRGYSMIQQTQDQWLNSRYVASSVEGGLGFPDWNALAAAYGLPTHTIATNADALEMLAAILEAPGPAFINVELNPDERVIPQVKFGRPIEDGEPLLPRAEFFENMIVEPIDASRT